ncbi:ATP-dependent nuclease [Oerskovia enterophila]|uniref:Uncharacterized protein n=1 Tax=Oerskovia enterophila TaxID=43678 RepID=A0ABX2Y7V6_9CELL|nr:ATP-binding protein [Oerskovia enterophila]OCI32599.1 hypothetical protein OERS_05260 [Oerskovia enterophila]
MANFVRLTMGGLRGFAQEQSLEFAQPNGSQGSGLTLLVGANNSGKSTIIEGLRALSQSAPPAFSSGRRNRAFGDRVMIRLEGADGEPTVRLESVRPGGSEATAEGTIESGSLFVVPSRRSFAHLFHASINTPGDRVNYLGRYRDESLRQQNLSNFEIRLFSIDRDASRRATFQKMMSRVIDPPPEWTIDQSDNGQHFLKYRWPSPGGLDSDHSSEGLGDGLTSLLSIIDALYDSEPSTMIVIDEPELSLHPEYQRRLAALLVDLSKDRQIVCATHSPYFISWEAISNGACVVRTYRSPDGCQVRAASRDSLRSVARSVRDTNNPHTLGLQANEVFFLHDRVILVEGQEDVVFFDFVMKALGVELPGSFFGWGVGGAGKMGAFAGLLRDLGYEFVVGILDNDKTEERDKLRTRFPEYHFECIPAADIRTKEAQPPREEKVGLLDSKGRIREEHKADTADMFSRIKAYCEPTTVDIPGIADEDHASQR